MIHRTITDMIQRTFQANLFQQFKFQSLSYSVNHSRLNTKRHLFFLQLPLSFYRLFIFDRIQAQIPPV